ncbi:hypothetical protein DRE_00869 [Drechslerella stenobrocha 248]|uniref:Uncharacterized protein n=1 Tax=Drechslerella stenobrocha 248 TaxID=1043628 RepID=W7I8Y8_9PEZI|nr:hypothetical protein DRE_00869 [Drechslerella stenobrocha 248]
MEYSLSNDSSMEEDFMLYSSTDEDYLRQHPLDIFPGEEGFSMFGDVPTSMDAIDSDIFNPDFFKLPKSTAHESAFLGFHEPPPLSYIPSSGQTYTSSIANVGFGVNNGYPTPPSTIPSPYSSPANTFVPFSPTTRTRRQSSSRRKIPTSAASPPSSPPAAGASSPTGGKQGQFTCHKCNAQFTFKTNKTRHLNSRACEGKTPSSSSQSSANPGDAGCTREYPCPIPGCTTVIKRRKDNLSVHLKKIHGLKMMEVARQ